MEEEFYLYITVDTNDADYIISCNIVLASTIEKIQPLIEAIKNFKPYKVTIKDMERIHDHNFPYGECCRKDLGEKDFTELYKDFSEELLHEFELLIPDPEYGFHKIESIKAYPVSSGIVLM